MELRSTTLERTSVTPTSDLELEAHLQTDAFIGDLSEQSLGDSIFASINDAIVVVNSDAVIERVNPATLELTGFDEDELVGSHVELLTRNRNYFEKTFSKSLHKSIVGNRFEMKCRRKDGTHFPLSVSTSTIFDAKSDARKLICVGRDITKRKRLEAESRAISRIIHGAATTTNLEELFQLIHRSIKKIGL